MRTHCIIPARFGSTRFPGKPLALIDGKPMIVRTWERAQEAFGLDTVIVATDADEIATVCAENRIRFVLTPSHLENGTERCAHVADRFGFHPDDIVVNLQGDSPLALPAHIEQVARGVTEHQRVATLVTPIEGRGVPIEENAQVFVALDHQWRALYFSRRVIPAGLPHRLWAHIGIYAYRVDMLHRYSAHRAGPLETHERLEQLRWLEYNYPVRCVEAIPNAALPEVNNPEDIKRVEEVLHQWRDTNTV